MAEGLSNDLLWATFWIGLVSFIISSKDFSLPTAFVISLIKVLIPFVYFAFFFDGTWTFLDDIEYQSQGTTMLERGYNPVSTLLTSHGLANLFSLSGGFHILYGWWNVLAQYLFGQHYYSAIFLNVALTFVSGYFLFRVVRLCSFGQKYAQAFIVFFLFHWDVLVWSSLVNLKEILVLSLTIICFYSFLKILKTKKTKYYILLAAAVFPFLFLRFYLPFLLLIAGIAWVAVYQKGKRKYNLIFVLVIGFIFVLNFLGARATENFGRVDMLSAVPGAFRMALTPRPWVLNETSSFLVIPSILHWLFFIPSLWSAWKLSRRSKEISLLLIYLLVILLFYGSYEAIQGIRQRFQVSFIISWIQFHFIWLILRKKIPPSKPKRLNRSLIKLAEVK